MPKGNTDIFTSRRVNFIECKYWLVSKEEAQKNKEDIAYSRIHNGTFEAKFENQMENTMSVIGQTFMFDSNTVSISTQDDIYELKKNCLVEFLGMIWRINNITKIPIRNNFQLCNDIKFKYFLELRR